jgi:hypothetical protein
MKDLAERNALEDQYVAFLRSKERFAALSAFLASELQRHPRRSKFYGIAADLEIDQGNTDNARAIVQKGLDVLPEQPSVWRAALRTELRFAHTVLSGMQRDSTNKRNKAAAVRSTNEALGSILFDLALVETIIRAAWQSPSAGAVLLTALLEELLGYEFASTMMYLHLQLALRTAAEKMNTVARRTDSMKKKNAALLCEALLRLIALPRVLLQNRCGALPADFVEQKDDAKSSANRVETTVLNIVSLEATAVLDEAAHRCEALLVAAAQAVNQLMSAGADVLISDGAFEQWCDARLIRHCAEPRLASLYQPKEPSVAVSTTMADIHGAVEPVKRCLNDESLIALLNDQPAWSEANAPQIKTFALRGARVVPPLDGRNTDPTATVLNLWARVTAADEGTDSGGVSLGALKDIASPAVSEVNVFWRYHALRSLLLSSLNDNELESDADDLPAQPSRRQPAAGRHTPAGPAVAALQRLCTLTITDPHAISERAEGISVLSHMVLVHSIADSSSPRDVLQHREGQYEEMWASSQPDARNAAVTMIESLHRVLCLQSVNLPVGVIRETVLRFATVAASSGTLDAAQQATVLAACRRFHRYIVNQKTATADDWASFIRFESGVAKRPDFAATLRREAERALKSTVSLISALNQRS